MKGSGKIILWKIACVASEEGKGEGDKKYEIFVPLPPLPSPLRLLRRLYGKLHGEHHTWARFVNRKHKCLESHRIISEN